MIANDSRGGARNASNARATGQQRPNSTAADTNRKVTGKPVQQTSTVNQKPSTPTPTPSEYLSVQSFNVEEVTKFLSNGINPQAKAYVVNQQSAQAKGNPWSKKAGAMANGRDFWLELRKQVTALRQSGGVSQGG